MWFWSQTLPHSDSKVLSHLQKAKCVYFLHINSCCVPHKDRFCLPALSVNVTLHCSVVPREDFCTNVLNDPVMAMRQHLPSSALPSAVTPALVLEAATQRVQYSPHASDSRECFGNPSCSGRGLKRNHRPDAFENAAVASPRPLPGTCLLVVLDVCRHPLCSRPKLISLIGAH